MISEDSLGQLCVGFVCPSSPWHMLDIPFHIHSVVLTARSTRAGSVLNKIKAEMIPILCTVIVHVAFTYMNDTKVSQEKDDSMIWIWWMNTLEHLNHTLLFRSLERQTSKDRWNEYVLCAGYKRLTSPSHRITPITMQQLSDFTENSVPVVSICICICICISAWLWAMCRLLHCAYRLYCIYVRDIYPQYVINLHRRLLLKLRGGEHQSRQSFKCQSSTKISDITNIALTTLACPRERDISCDRPCELNYC